jgi:diacylglycerol O-acyltransferase
MTTSMRAPDAFARRMEKDPTLRSTIVGVAWLDGSPSWDQLLATIDRATRLLPMFRQRVIETAGMRVPRWTTDESFDLSRHVHRMTAPEPRTDAVVIALARTATMTAFDPAHPLWEFTLVEHLEGHRAALIMKVHHALTDGIGGMQLALEVFDLDPVAPSRAPIPGDADVEAAEVETRAQPAFAAALRTVRRISRHPVRSASETYETVRSIARTLAPVRTTLSPLMKERSERRNLDIIEMRLSDLKRAAAVAGGSVNDGFLAAVTAGLRRYHELHGAPVDRLRVTMPISIRTADDPPGGNRITLIRFRVPVADPHPIARIRAMGPLCRNARDERSLGFTGAIARTLNLLPRAAIGAMLKHVDFVASDIPGFAFPIYLAGARVERYVAFPPTVGTALNFALLSYDGTCCVGVVVDSDAVADPDVLIDCAREGFEEVLALGGPHEPVTLPLRATAADSGVAR